MAASFDRIALGFFAAMIAAGALAAVFPPSCGVVARPHQGSGGGAAAAPSLAGTALPPPAAAPAQPAAIDLAAIAAGASVPRPPDGLGGDRGIAAGATRQEMFLARILPQVLLADEAVRVERARLWAIRQQLNRGDRLPAEDRLWLGAAAERYQVGQDDTAELGRRIDTVPASILLAAAALATRWNVADEPAWRAMAATIRTKAAAPPVSDAPARLLSPPADALGLYLWSINTQPAYLPFRRARERARLAGSPLAGSGLAATLPRVAPVPLPGATALAAAITSQQLDRFDAARLEAAGGRG